MKGLLSLFLAFSALLCGGEQPRVLHLSFHKGCIREFEGVAKKLSLDVTSWFIPSLPPGSFDGKSKGSVLYNIGHQRAADIWELHREFFESFDIIMTSDTAPLSRIFLQNGWSKPLIIWICNRFDYADSSSLDCDFPDQEYYRLFAEARNKRNVTIVAYTEFEHLYARSKGVDTGTLTITPGAVELQDKTVSLVPSHVIKSETFFLPPYHNETLFMDLSAHCKKIGIPAYCGRYNGPSDLKDFKGIIHIPYALSNLALFENIRYGIPYFVPSCAFLRRLAKQNNFFFQGGNLFANSEWYNPKHRDIFTYFDSWEDLKLKIVSADYDSLRQKTTAYGQALEEHVIQQWADVFQGAANAQ